MEIYLPNDHQIKEFILDTYSRYLDHDERSGGGPEEYAEKVEVTKPFLRALIYSVLIGGESVSVRRGES